MIDDAAHALLHFEVEPNYGGWTLLEYVTEKLKRPLAPAVLDRLLRGRALIHREPELLPETRIWPGLRFSLRKRSPGDEGEPPPIGVIYEDDALLVVDKPPGLAQLPAARFPLVGDTLYGPDEGIFLKLAESDGAPAPRGTFDDLITAEERRALRHFRQALHASELTLPHPATGERLRFESPLPDDLQQLLSTLTPA